MQCDTEHVAERTSDEGGVNCDEKEDNQNRNVEEGNKYQEVSSLSFRYLLERLKMLKDATKI